MAKIQSLLQILINISISHLKSIEKHYFQMKIYNYLTIKLIVMSVEYSKQVKRFKALQNCSNCHTIIFMALIFNFKTNNREQNMHY